MMVKEVSEHINVVFWDFSYAKPELIEKKDSYFYDASHMNGEGAEIFSSAVVSLLKRYDDLELRESDYFYSSFDEMDVAIDRIVNTWYDYKAVDGEFIITANSYHGSDVIPEYILLLQ